MTACPMPFFSLAVPFLAWGTRSSPAAQAEALWDPGAGEAPVEEGLEGYLPRIWYVVVPATRTFSYAFTQAA